VCVCVCVCVCDCVRWWLGQVVGVGVVGDAGGGRQACATDQQAAAHDGCARARRRAHATRAAVAAYAVVATTAAATHLTRARQRWWLHGSGLGSSAGTLTCCSAGTPARMWVRTNAAHTHDSPSRPSQSHHSRLISTRSRGTSVLGSPHRSTHEPCSCCRPSPAQGTPWRVLRTRRWLQLLWEVLAAVAGVGRQIQMRVATASLQGSSSHQLLLLLWAATVARSRGV
jgi:hypothetical protein